MTVKLAPLVVGGEPAGDKTGATRRVARLVIAMGAGVRRIGVLRIKRERALDLGGTGGDIAQLDARPNEIGQKPPILVPIRGEAQQQRQLRLVEIGAAAKPQETKDAKRQR